MIFTVQDVLEGHGKPVSISPDEGVLEALSIMTENDFSQLPVVGEQNKPLGIVTSDSILRAANLFGVLLKDLKVHDSMVPAKTTRNDGDLFELLDDVQRSYAVLAVDAQGSLIGIVTNYDTTAYFRRRAEDMMLVEDVETTLKEYILAIYRGGEGKLHGLRDTISSVAGSARRLREKYEVALKAYLRAHGSTNTELDAQRVDDSFKCFGVKDEPKDFDQLTIDEFTAILLRHKDCPKVGTAEGSDAVRKLLNSVRETRNILAHFRGDITPQQRDELRFCANWLSRALSALPREAKTTPPLRSPSRPETEPPPIEEDPQPTDSVYAPLAAQLQSVPLGTDEVVLTLSAIEQIIGRKLPDSARNHRAWWSNDPGHAQAKQWIGVGWRVRSLSADSVVFCRAKEREAFYDAFFGRLAAALRETGVLSLPDAQPSGRSYFWCTTLRGSARRQLRIYASFARSGRLRIELYMGLGVRKLNKSCWQSLYDHRGEIEQQLGEPLAWERLDGKDAARVALYGPSPTNEGLDEQLINWATGATVRMVQVLREPVRKALDAL